MEGARVVQNILLTHFYSERNGGDAAILFVMVKYLRRIFNGAQLSLVTMDRFNPGDKVESMNLYHSFFYDAVYASGSALVRVSKVFWVCATTTLWAWCFHFFGLRLDWLVGKSELRTLLAYVNSELIIPVGGGYILGKNSLRGTVTVLLQLHALYIGVIFKKPIILFPQSIGPFGNWLQRFMANVVLNRVNVIYVREKLSLETLLELKITKPVVKKAADMALLLQEDSANIGTNILKQYGVTGDRPIVTITVRDWLTPVAQRRFEKAMVEFVQTLTTLGYSVVFVPQVTSGFHNDDDSIVQDKIRTLLPASSNYIYFLPKGLSFLQISAVYKSCEYVVGTRMHSVIFALTAHVPALAIAYERKTLGIMSELGLQDFVVKIEDATLELLTRKFKHLVVERQEYLTTLNRELPKQQALALSVFDQVRVFFTHN